MDKKITELIKEYSKFDSYKQGVAGHLLYLSYPWVRVFEPTLNHKRIAPRIGRLLGYLRGDLFTGWWSKAGMEKIARFYFKKNLQPANFINNLKYHWEKHDLAGVLALAQKIERTDLTKLTRPELLRLFNEFSRAYVVSWREAIFLDSFDLMGEPLLEEVIKKSNINLSADDLHILISMTKLSSLQTEKKNLLNLTSAAAADKNLKKAIINNDLPSLARHWPEFFQRLQKHSENYHWIYNDFVVIKYLDGKFFLQAMRKWLLNPEDLHKDKMDIAAVARLKARRQKLMHKKRFSRDVVRAIDLMVVLSQWRDLRKMQCQIANGAVHLLAAEFSRRNNIPLKKVESLFWWELPELFTNRKKPLVKISTQRYGGSFFEGRLDRDPVHFGRAAEELRLAADRAIQDNAKLSGRPAFAGQATGRVRIILAQDSFKKMKRGDILVAYNTRPEYVPIMKLAGAIITEEGGITSHAAIVSRELKIPCVVGVQGITGILKDGDKVEVDAVKGLVRKL